MTDEADKRTHAQRRREEARKGARLKLQAGQFVRRLKEIAERADRAEPSAVPGLRLKADIYMKLLAKCLPDLKSIEHSGTMTHQHIQELSEAELARIAAGGSAGAAEATQSTH